MCKDSWETQNLRDPHDLFPNLLDNFDRCRDEGIVPECGEVLRLYFFYLSYDKSGSPTKQRHAAIEATIAALDSLCIDLDVRMVHRFNVKNTVIKLLDDYGRVAKNAKSTSPAQKQRERVFLQRVQQIFPLAHHATSEYSVGLTQQQCLARIRKMPDFTPIHEGEEDKEVIPAKRRRMELGPKCEPIEVDGVDDKVDGEFGGGISDGIYQPPSRYRLPKLRPITGAFLMELHRSGNSHRSGARLLGAHLASFWKLEASDVVLSNSTMWRAMNRFRESYSAKIMGEFVSNPPTWLNLHQDAKSLQLELDSQVKVNRLVVSVSFEGGTKVLGIPFSVESTGAAEAEAIAGAIPEPLRPKVKFVSSDSPSVCTGAYEGINTHLESLLGLMLIWLICRHHILEIVCGAVATLLYGDTTSPGCQVFSDFRKSWDEKEFDYKKRHAKQLNDPRFKQGGSLHDHFIQASDFFKSLIADPEFKKKFSKDYIELIELSLLLLGFGDHLGEKHELRQAGAVSNARWMQRIIYTLTMYLLRDQITTFSDKEWKEMKELCIFFVLIYIPQWIRCTSAPRAPALDLRFIKTLVNYRKINKKIAEAALTAFLRHGWYLGGELVALALWDKTLSDKDKRELADAIICQLPFNANTPRSRRFIADRQTRSKNNPAVFYNALSRKSLKDFVDPATPRFFMITNMDYSFLGLPVSEWNQHKGFMDGARLVDNLLVVNDVAERGVALITRFLHKFTTNEEQFQAAIQVIERSLQICPKDDKESIFRAACQVMDELDGIFKA